MRIVDAHARTDVGFERDHNEDAAMTSLSHGVFVVADGMGGHAAGEVAAAIASSTAADALKIWPGTRDQAALVSAFAAADAAVRARADADPACHGMGTTLAAVALDGATAWIGHIGDSRVYLLRGDELHRLTSDHGFGNTLTRAIGTYPPAGPDVFSVELQDGDTLMLCTDGLSKVVRSSMIQRALQLHPTSCELATDALVVMALAAGGPDNVTVVVLRVAA